MNADERAHALMTSYASYVASTAPEYDEVIHVVAERAADEGSLGKAEIGAVVLWKRLNASTRWSSRLMSLPDAEVRAATRSARAAAVDRELSLEDAAMQARTALTPLPGFGVGDALASAVIFALAPDRMAVYDRRAQAGLERLGKQLTAQGGRYGRYMALVESLMSDVAMHGHTMTARQIDLALYVLGKRPADAAR